MIKKLRVAVDHGNRNMKTCHFIFTTGLTEQDKKPARGEKYLKYQGKYYTLSEKRIPYQRDKTQDSRNRFWILTLFAIAMELEQKSQIQPEDVIQVELPIGLPPKHFAELCERYERYFKGDGKVQELCFNDKVYHLCIQNVMAFPQDYAAMMTRMMEIREIPKVVGIDIGGFTSDYLLMRSGRPDMDYCDSLEKGVITMYNDIISSITRKGAATYIGSAVILTVTVTNLWGWLVYPAEMLKNQWFLFITSLCPGNYVFAVSGSCSYCDSTGLLPDYLQVKHCSGFEFEFWQSNNSILD